MELRHAGTAPLELGGLILASPNGRGSSTLPSTQLPPGALISLNAATLGFSPPSTARLFLFSPAQSSLLDARRLSSTGKALSDDTTQWLVPTGPTPGTPNPFLLSDPLLIPEIHYHHRTISAFPGTFTEPTMADLPDPLRYHSSGTHPGPLRPVPAQPDKPLPVRPPNLPYPPPLLPNNEGPRPAPCEDSGPPAVARN